MAHQNKQQKFTWRQLFPLIYVVAVVFMMNALDASTVVGYFPRAAIKFCLFAVFPYFYLKSQHLPMPTLKHDQYLKKVLFLMAVIIAFILIGSLGFHRLGFLNNVKNSLATVSGVTAKIYPLVFLHVVFINGPLEELFFRHNILQLEIKYKKLVSSLLFAIYHVGMLYTMFPWYIFLLVIAGLMFVGYFFVFVNTKKYSILNSILIHMAANFAINIVGWMLLMV